MHIAVLMSCHNRRETTLKCLASMAGQCGGDRVDVFVVDDGSTDGTAEAVKNYFNSLMMNSSSFKLHSYSADGSLFWAKGIALAWGEALKYEKSLANRTYAPDYDCFLWLNDDAELYPHTMKALRECVRTNPEAVTVGELENSRGEIVYGKRGDLFTGNFVCVPRIVFEKVGMISGGFHHAWADSDYAMRCKRLGVRVVSCGVVGRCEGHPNRPSLAGMSLGERWRSLSDPKGWCVHDLWLYRRRNWGFLSALGNSIKLILHVLFSSGK